MIICQWFALCEQRDLELHRPPRPRADALLWPVRREARDGRPTPGTGGGVMRVRWRVVAAYLVAVAFVAGAVTHGPWEPAPGHARVHHSVEQQQVP